MKTKVITLYSFQELSKEAKVKAIENFRERENENQFEYYTSDAMATIKKALDEFNVTLRDYSIDFQDANRSWVKLSFNHDYKEVDEMTGNRLRTWLLNHFYFVFYSFKKYGEWGKKRRTSKIAIAENCCPFTGVCYDESFLDPFREFLTKPDNSNFHELIQEGIHQVIKGVDGEINYQLSDKGIEETIEANEYDFLENGELA